MVKALLTRGKVKAQMGLTKLTSKVVKGDSHFLAVAVVMIIVVVLAALFRNQLTNIFNNVFNNVGTKVNGLF